MNATEERLARMLVEKERKYCRLLSLATDVVESVSAGTLDNNLAYRHVKAKAYDRLAFEVIYARKTTGLLTMKDDEVRAEVERSAFEAKFRTDPFKI